MEKQNKTLEKLTVSIILRGLNGGATNKEAIERIGEVLESVSELGGNFSEISRAIQVRYEGLMNYHKSEMERNNRRLDTCIKHDMEYQESTIANHIAINNEFIGVYRLACDVLKGQLSIDNWKSKVEDLDSNSWKENGLERYYTLFE